MSNTPQIRFAGFTDAWEQRKFSDFTFAAGERNKDDLDLEPFAITNNQGFIAQSEAHDDFGYMKDVDRKMYIVVKPNSFAYNPARINVGSLGYYEGAENVIVSSLYEVFQTAEYVDDKFLKHWFKTKAFQDWIERLQEGSVRLYFYYDKLCECIMSMPSVEEQRKIGAYLDKIDNLITLHQRKCDALQKFKKSMLQKMFPQNGESVPEIRFAGFTDAWEQRKFSDFTFAAGERNKDDLDLEPFAITNNQGFIAQSEAHDDFGYMKDVDRKMYIVVKPNSFAYNPARINVGSLGYYEGAENVIVSSLYEVFQTAEYVDDKFLKHWFKTKAFQDWIERLQEGSVRLYFYYDKLCECIMSMPSVEEQRKIGAYLDKIDNLITLHQREPPKEDKILNDIKTDTLFHEYYCQWLVIYKEGSVRGVTMQKYHLTAEWVKKLIPDVKLCDFDRITYQQLINDYAETHERQTTMDFHHQLKGAILDAVDDGLIARDPTRKVIIKGKSPNDKKKKYLSRYELQKLLTSLDLNSGLNMDWLILLIAKTGMRFSEAIAVTPMDFDFTHQTLSVNKTWDYKGEGGFQPTKNKSSVRKIRLDWQTVGQFYAIVRELNDTAPIFVSKEKKIYNSTLNDVLERHCKAVGIPTISVHGLRHTHASLLLFDGVSIASVAQRLGHSSINTTQKTYLHIIRELENKDIDLIMKSISSLLD
mgnify:CR=1 FL=1